MPWVQSTQGIFYSRYKRFDIEASVTLFFAIFRGGGCRSRGDLSPDPKGEFGATVLDVAKPKEALRPKAGSEATNTIGRGMNHPDYGPYRFVSSLNRCCWT